MLAVAGTELDSLHGDGVVRLDEIDKCAGGAALDRSGRDQRHILQCVDEQLYVDELVGKQALVGIVENRPQLDRPGGRIDLVVNRLQLSDRELGRAGTVIGGRLQCCPGVQPLQHLLQAVFGQREDDRDRLQLGYDDDPVGIAGLDIIPGIDLAQPNSTGQRRDNVGVGQIELLRVDLSLIQQYLRPILGDRRNLGVARLSRDRVLCDESVVALQVDLGVIQGRLVFGELRLRLFKRHLIRTRIDLGEEITFFDVLALGECDTHQIAVDLGLDRNHRQRRHRPEPVQRDRHIALLRGRYSDRSGAGGHRAPAAALARRRLMRKPRQIDHRRGDDRRQNQDPQQHAQPRAPSRSRLRLGRLVNEISGPAPDIVALFGSCFAG